MSGPVHGVDCLGSLGPPSASAPAPTLPMFVSCDELADILRVNRKSIYSAAKRGEIPGVRRIGKTIRFHTASVLAWFAASTRPRQRGRHS